MFIDNTLVAGSRDAKRYGEPLAIGTIIDLLRSDAYAPGATDVRTLDEDLFWYCALPFEQRMAVNQDQADIYAEVARREEAAQETKMMDCALCCKPTVQAEMIEMLCQSCDHELAMRSIYDDGAGRCHCSGRGECDYCRWNGSFPGEGGPEHDWADYPNVCQGCYEEVGAANLVNGGCAECNHRLHEEQLAAKLMMVASGVQAEHWPDDEYNDLPF